MKNEKSAAQTHTPNSVPRTMFVVGTTATGKSGLAMRVAKELNGELICADSQTLRRGLDIGTAKPSKQDQADIVHHMLDIIDPYERYSVAQFQKAAKQLIQDIQSRGKLPILVGGTGLYIDSVYYSYALSDEPTDDELEEKSVRELQEMITDNGWALPNNPQNTRHLVGVIRRNGSKPVNKDPIDGAVIVGMKRSDDVLKQRISDRIEAMLESGLLQEVRALINKHGRPPSRMDAIGYPIVLRYMDGEIDMDTAKELFKSGDWQYARRQKAWFARNEHIQWFDTELAAFEYIKNIFAM